MKFLFFFTERKNPQKTSSYVPTIKINKKILKIVTFLCGWVVSKIHLSILILTCLWTSKRVLAKSLNPDELIFESLDRNITMSGVPLSMSIFWNHLFYTNLSNPIVPVTPKIIEKTSHFIPCWMPFSRCHFMDMVIHTVLKLFPRGRFRCNRMFPIKITVPQICVD